MAKRKAKRKAKKKPRVTSLSFSAMKKMLLEKRDTILDEIAHGARELKTPSRRADLADMASETADGAVGLELYQSGSSELAEIETALQKIEEGTYGTCRTCGERIPSARLKALPFATLCVKCKERAELVHRARQGGAGSWAAAGGIGPEDEGEE